MDYLYIGIGGIFGAITRYGISKWVGRLWQGEFPLATFCINITGSFLLGLLFVVFSRASTAYLKNLTTTGFLGAYTTYSTFAYEIVHLIEAGEKAVAFTYFLASIVGGLIAAIAGMTLAGNI